MRVPVKACPSCKSFLTHSLAGNDAYEFISRANLHITVDPSLNVVTGDHGHFTARNRQIAFTGHIDGNQVLKTIAECAKVARPFAKPLADWVSKKLQTIQENQVKEVFYCSQCGYVKIT